MKTAITVLIVALAASIASADSIWFQMAPGSTPTPGGTIEIQLVADAPVVGWKLPGARAPLGCRVSESDDWRLHANIIGNQAKPNYIDNWDHTDGKTYLWYYSVWGKHYEGNSPVPAGETLVSFDLQINDTWDGVTPFTLEMIDNGEMYYYDGGSESLGNMAYGVFGSWDDPAYVYIADLTVPEPATMMLLIGGAVPLLRCRRRK